MTLSLSLRSLLLPAALGLITGGWMPLSAQDAMPEDMLDAFDEAASAKSATCLLVKPGEPMPVVVLGQDASAAERFAAEEMTRHLQLITGNEIEVVSETAVPEGRKRIVIGRSQLSTPQQEKELGLEQYLIEVTSAGVVILGGREEPVSNGSGGLELRERGTLYGVYDFLESLGVRWYRPEPWGWVTPRLETIELPVGLKVSDPPVFKGRSVLTSWRGKVDRGVAYDTREVCDWLSRMRANRRTSSEERYGGIYRLQISHGHNRVVPPEKYLEEHPEYFALVDGKRGNPGSGRTPQLCLGNPELQEVFARNVLQLAEKQPAMVSIGVDPEDGTHLGRRMCTCPLCIAMDDPRHPTIMSSRVFQFTNLIAQKIAGENPTLKLGTYAYSSHTEAPTRVPKLEPSIIVALANINAWGDISKPMHDPRSVQNQRFVALVKAWEKTATHPLWMREYGAYGWMGPMPMYRLIQDRVQAYKNWNFEGVDWPSFQNFGPQTLYLYLVAQLQWNPDLDVPAEMERYYRDYFGPAAAAMKAYDLKWAEAFEKSDFGRDTKGGIWSGGRGMHALCTPVFMDSLQVEIDRALEAAKGNELVGKRLKGVAAGYELCRKISEVLYLKLKDGVAKPGSGNPNLTVLESKKAGQEWKNLEVWLKQVNHEEGQLIFELTTEKGEIRSEPYSYMKRDVLENRRFFLWDEPQFLRKVGFGAARKK